jgi:hypothetical protein
MRSFVFSILVLSTSSLLAAPMVRITGVKDARTLLVDRGGLPGVVRLAGVLIPPGDDAAAIEFLHDKLLMRFAMVETDARGESYVYRSPDSLFINGELSRRAYLYQGTKMIIIGESAPGPERGKRKASSGSGKDPNRLLPPPKPRPVRHQPRGLHRVPRF